MLKLQITCDKTQIDFDRVYRCLNVISDDQAGIPHDVFIRAMSNALCFAGFLEGEQIAFARVVSDFATMATLADVFVEPEFRGNGYATALLTEVFAHPDLQGLRRFSLVTADMHSLYARFGFHAPALPETIMERYNPEVYRG